MAQTLQQGAMIADASITPEKLADTAFNQLRSGRKNYIINGNFGIWQRGTSFTGPIGGREYGADRMSFADGFDGTATMTRQTFSLPPPVPNNPTYYARVAMTTPATAGTPSVVTHPVESVRTLAGKKAVLSFWARDLTGDTVITPRLQQYFGTGGTPSEAVDTVAPDITVTGSWQKHEAHFDLPDIGGKTIGDHGNDFLSVILNVGINITCQVDIAQIQLEEGEVATDFEYRPIAEELALCQRYFFKTQETLPLLVWGQSVAERRIAAVDFPVTMRTIPTLTSVSATQGTIASLVAYPDGARFSQTDASAGQLASVNKFWADAEL